MYTQETINTYSITPSSFLTPVCIQPVPRQPLMCFLLPFPRIYLFQWNHVDMFFIVWFLSLGSVILRFSHAVASVSSHSFS